MFRTVAAAGFVLVSLAVWVRGQQVVVDKTVATVTDGVRPSL
jgi:hypothetical protein